MQPYVVKREGGRWVFVPTSMFAGVMAGAFGAGSAFVVYISTVFLRRANWWMGTILLLVAGLIAGLGIRAWRNRRTPLTIEVGGRVSYGEEELCAAGTVRAVRISPARSGEVNNCAVFLELAGGELVAIPSQYFGAFPTREQARPFAAELAEALGVEV